MLMYKVIIFAKDFPKVDCALFTRKEDAEAFTAAMNKTGIEEAILNKWTWETTIED